MLGTKVAPDSLKPVEATHYIKTLCEERTPASVYVVGVYPVRPIVLS
jgi:hypothetical protein